MGAPQTSLIILSGPRGSGKSTLLFTLLPLLRKEKLKVGGIIAQGLWQNGIRSGFNLLDLESGKYTPLCRRSDENGARQPTPFTFFEEGMASGEKALSVQQCSNADVVIVDEVGPLEIQGEGWAPLLSPLLELDRPVHIWVVRHDCVGAVKRIWGLEDVEVVDVNDAGAAGILKNFCTREKERQRAPREG